MRVLVFALALLPVAYGQSASSCAGLLQFKIPGVKLAITKTEAVPAAASESGSIPAHCLAEGMIDQRTGVGGKPTGSASLSPCRIAGAADF